MSLSNDDVLRIARLARIAIAPGESNAVVERLNSVLALVDEMRKVDTAGLEPMAHAVELAAAATQPMRADEATETSPREAYQALAPAVEAGLYLVPKVIE
ncbi:MAG: Asp-tRNA(Asn)/Glu-tRNA(Gln) amidotransferase subunit GatC [Betaproteobacteria bacterium]